MDIEDYSNGCLSVEFRHLVGKCSTDFWTKCSPSFWRLTEFVFYSS